jgi:hypothetical protein
MFLLVPHRLRMHGHENYQLLPINSESPGPLFCKVVMSSLVHGYSPIVFNWEEEGDGGYM